ncbi:uncharacterized protein BO88DRAFT_404633 [Aspergillus vadensis CBS 113365]|uniref:Uncharacterized protein n=1 Tax=Aspergillus vadensis (strain CBS 113365 / IMI 142717 / IBT 24658) TaxID=1448311 RepID=A0A319BB94_ASPVC|nr:hypothetical protein BO88DRAFT_404633 [Aspergillus vadensis CBS 113365]PYH69619.1 hypothetical protein BO88DRAFT_404633 [Aspergillus vadensis CBS 113365]
MDEFDDLTALSDTMVYRQVIMAFSPVIPASFRRRISRLYPSMHRSVKSEASASASAKANTAGKAGGDAMAAMRQTSEPGELEYVAPLPDKSSGPAFQRPSTASSASNGVEPCFSPGPEKSQELSDISSLRSTRSSGVFSPVAPKYEAESGLRWNRIAPALNLLQNACHEAQQRQCDSRLARMLYVDALSYLLDGLPDDMSTQEIMIIQENLPAGVKESLAAPAVTDPSAAGLHSMLTGKNLPPERSYLHRLLSSTIIYFFIMLQFLIPYVKILVYHLYRYERSHRLTERAVTKVLDAADNFGKRGMVVGAAVLNYNEGRVSANMMELAAWWVTSIAGGIYEGFAEGMVIMGVTQSHVELGKAFVQASRS